MDLKDWTGTTTFLARFMLTLGTVAVTLSLAKYPLLLRWWNLMLKQLQ